MIEPSTVLEPLSSRNTTWCLFSPRGNDVLQYGRKIGLNSFSFKIERKLFFYHDLRVALILLTRKGRWDFNHSLLLKIISDPTLQSPSCYGTPPYIKLRVPLLEVVVPTLEILSVKVLYVRVVLLVRDGSNNLEQESRFSRKWRDVS